MLEKDPYDIKTILEDTKSQTEEKTIYVVPEEEKDPYEVEFFFLLK